MALGLACGRVPGGPLGWRSAKAGQGRWCLRRRHRPCCASGGARGFPGSGRASPGAFPRRGRAAAPGADGAGPRGYATRPRRHRGRAEAQQIRERGCDGTDQGYRPSDTAAIRHANGPRSGGGRTASPEPTEGTVLVSSQNGDDYAPHTEDHTGARIARVRKRRHLTQRELADLAHVSYAPSPKSSRAHCLPAPASSAHSPAPSPSRSLNSRASPTSTNCAKTSSTD